MTLDLDSILNILSIAGQVVGAASVVAAAVPQTSKAGPALATARQVLDVIALNLGGAKNAKATPKP